MLREVKGKVRREIIYLAGFLYSIPAALTAYINSSFLERYATTYYVGVIYIVGSVLTIWALSAMPKILTRFGNRRIVIIFSVLNFLALIFLALSNTGSIIVLAFILAFVIGNLLIACLDIFMEDFSTHVARGSSIGRFRGWYLMVINGAWVLAQLISGSIIDQSSYGGIYLFSAGFMLLGALVFVVFLRDFEDPIYKKTSLRKTFRFFLQNRNILKIYFLNFILKFFFAWMIIYTPIYLHEHIGFAWDQIGIIFTIMLLPFVILSYPLGKLSDKVGEKKMLTAGFAITAFSTALIPLLSLPIVWLWALVLFFTRVGAATIEVMSESYFFKSVTEENVDAISFFRNTAPLSFIIAPLVALPFLVFLPSFSQLFFILAAILLLGLFFTLRLRDIK